LTITKHIIKLLPVTKLIDHSIQFEVQQLHNQHQAKIEVQKKLNPNQQITESENLNRKLNERRRRRKKLTATLKVQSNQKPN
jgi:hypothetical protein